MRKHYLRILGRPNIEGNLPKIRLCTSDLKVQDISNISIQSVQVHFQNVAQYETAWEITSNLVEQTVWDGRILRNLKTPLANLVVKKENNCNLFTWNANNWIDITSREQFLNIRLHDPILNRPINDAIMVYLIIGLSTCDQ